MIAKNFKTTAKAICRNTRSLSTKLENEIHGKTTEVIKKQTKDGYFEQAITIITKPSPQTKGIMIAYGTGLVATSMQTSYNVGKSALYDHRTCNPNSEQDEFTIVRDACKNESWNSLWSGIWWPATWSSRITPNAVMWLNPKRD